MSEEKSSSQSAITGNSIELLRIAVNTPFVTALYMKKFDKITLKNFKCFDDQGIVIDTINQINVIIGKNNSGKSALIDLFRFLTKSDNSIFGETRNNLQPEIICEHSITHSGIVNSFPNDTVGGLINGNIQQYGLSFIDKTLFYSLEANREKKFLKIDSSYHPESEPHFKLYVHELKSDLQNKQFSHLSAERDVTPEKSHLESSISSKGLGATNYIQATINDKRFDSALIEDLLLGELNKILKPDIEFLRIRVQHDKNQIWEIYFQIPRQGWIPLSKMGSGVKTILLVLLNIHVIPDRNHVSKGEYVFAFEELENNLHPSLQRRLYNYISDFAKEHKSIFFLTTHSNIVIDLYSSCDFAQLFHITKAEARTTLNIISQEMHLKQILDDLEIRASDLLQSNGIIWVEGPSDRVYINKWINLLNTELTEGSHYSIMFYGGRLLSNLSFGGEVINKELIPLLKINQNAYVVIDRDGESDEAKINDTKARIQNEIGQNSTWITHGREIENYLSQETLETWLLNEHNITVKLGNDSNKKLENILLDSSVSNKIKYEKAKNRYASEIVKYIGIDSMSQDLKNNIENIIGKIKNWNQLS